MNPLYQRLLRPQPEHARHRIDLLAQAPAGRTVWSDTIHIKTDPALPPAFYFWQLPAPLLRPGGSIRQLSNERSQLILSLAGDAGAVTFQDLSNTPLEQWPAVLRHRLAAAPAAVAVLVVGGHISLVLNEGGEP